MLDEIFKFDSLIIHNSWINASQRLTQQKLINKPSWSRTVVRLDRQLLEIAFHCRYSCHVLATVRMKTILSNTRIKVSSVALTDNRLINFIYRRVHGYLRLL